MTSVYLLESFIENQKEKDKNKQIKNISIEDLL